MLFKTVTSALALLASLSFAIAAPFEIPKLDPNGPLYRQSPTWAANEHRCLRMKGFYDFPAQLIHADIYDGPLHVCGIHKFFDFYDTSKFDRIPFDCMDGYKASISRDMHYLSYTTPGWQQGQKTDYSQYWHDTWDMGEGPTSGSRTHREFILMEQRTDECLGLLGYIDSSKYGSNDGRATFFKFIPGV